MLFTKVNLGINLVGFPLFAGDYKDIGVGWYREVGSAMVLTMIAFIVEPHTSLAIAYLKNNVYLWYDRRLSCDRRYTRRST